MRKKDLSLETKKRLSMVKVVLFDLDGTVINTIDLITSSFRYATRKVLGRRLPDEVLLHNLGTPLLDQMKVLSPENAEELAKVYREHNLSHHDQMIQDYPGVRSVLDRLTKRDYRLGIVTSKSGPLARRGLAVLRLEPYFEVVVAMDDTVEHKPLPAPVLFALNEMDVAAGEAIFVGDSPHDLKAGKAAGVLTAAALWGPFDRKRLLAEEPDVILDQMAELLGLLSKDAG